MFCRKCGAELRTNAKFCGKCGAPAPVRGMSKSEPARTAPRAESVVPEMSIPKDFEKKISTETVRSKPKAVSAPSPSKREKKPELISSMPKPSDHKGDGDIHDWFSDAGDL